MKIIVGLGNIGDKYAYTYHNLGFLAVEAICDRLGAEFNKKGCDATLAFTDYKGERIILAKPTTFMNRSGQSVQKLLNYYKCPQENLIVIYDDIDIEKGTIRYRESGSSGTHNGMRDICYYLDRQFKRVKIGAGRPTDGRDLASYVLSVIPIEERPIFIEAIEQAVDKVLSLIN